MITAAEAKALSGPSADDHLKVIEKYIRRAAAEKKSEVLIKEEPYAYWLYGGQVPTEDVPKEVVRKLREAGFTVNLYYRETQFVDIGLYISW